MQPYIDIPMPKAIFFIYETELGWAYNFKKTATAIGPMTTDLIDGFESKWAAIEAAYAYYDDNIH